MSFQGIASVMRWSIPAAVVATIAGCALQAPPCDPYCQGQECSTERDTPPTVCQNLRSAAVYGNQQACSDYKQALKTGNLEDRVYECHWSSGGVCMRRTDPFRVCHLSPAEQGQAAQRELEIRRLEDQKRQEKEAERERQRQLDAQRTEEARQRAAKEEERRRTEAEEAARREAQQPPVYGFAYIYNASGTVTPGPSCLKQARSKAASEVADLTTTAKRDAAAIGWTGGCTPLKPMLGDQHCEILACGGSNMRGVGAFMGNIYCDSAEKCEEARHSGAYLTVAVADALKDLANILDPD